LGRSGAEFRQTSLPLRAKQINKKIIDKSFEGIIHWLVYQTDNDDKLKTALYVLRDGKE
jgi:hypothetical protein